MLHFVHQVCAGSLFAGPRLRACFIIDDPNIHWRRYGHVDFREIATAALKDSYHLAFATIPLDSWFTHAPTAQVFRNNSSHISLLIHGNNHTYKELADRYSEPERISLLTQAIRRIEHLERGARLKVSRVMAPPHGACSESVLEDLPKCGFEAATISHGSLHSFNRGRPWTRSLGYLPCEHIRGCPVLPRWNFTGDPKSTILLAAYLKQPIVLMGHHEDLRNGIEILGENARFINSLGPILWSNMADLCRANYQWRLDGNILRLKPLGIKLVVDVPEGADYLVIEGGFESAPGNWRIARSDRAPQDIVSGLPLSLPRGSDRLLSIQGIANRHVCVGKPNRQPLTWAILRRLLTESRDRVFGSWQ